VHGFGGNIRMRSGFHLQKPSSKLENNIKMDLSEIDWWREVDWSGSERGQVVCSCIRDGELLVFIKCVKFVDWMRRY
jgi:hypothetical protein